MILDEGFLKRKGWPLVAGLFNKSRKALFVVISVYSDRRSMLDVHLLVRFLVKCMVGDAHRASITGRYKYLEFGYKVHHEASLF
jgi:hypothetical protein